MPVQSPFGCLFHRDKVLQNSLGVFVVLTVFVHGFRQSRFIRSVCRGRRQTVQFVSDTLQLPVFLF